MKTIKKLMLSLFLGSFVLLAQAEVNFHEGDFASLLAKAKEANKPILIDAYTVWCGPCKMLDKQVFKDDKASDYINKNFIAYKLDMEKGEGPFVAMKFRVNAYPSTLFLSPEGYLLTKNIGFPGKDGYVDWCKDVVDNKYKPFQNINASNMDISYPEFYKNSFTSDKWKRKRPTVDQINNYLDSQEGRSLFSEVNWSVISVLSYYNHNHLNWVVENQTELKRLYPEEEIQRVIERIIGVKADSLAKLKTNDGDKVLKAEIAKLGIDDERLIKNSMFDYYYKAQHWGKLLDFAISSADDGKPSPGMMNSICWAIYEKCEDKAVLAKAAKAMEKAVKEDDNPNYIDTLAHLYFATGDLDGARKTAQEALEKGKAKDMTMKETEELLDKLQ